ncbi:P-loop containing nucleoside triphosphate hydrolase protein, partial [Microdochium bolleyi]
MAASTKSKTWRARGIGLRCSNACLQRLLSRADEGGDIQIRSLAVEHHGRSKTATVDFRGDAATPPPGSLLPCAEHGGEAILLDEHFLGFTTLFAPPDEDYQLDIIALSGLGGHAFGSFKERGGEHMWLRDSLPRHLVGRDTGRPMARVLIYGYGSPVAGSTSMQNVDDIAGRLRHGLADLVVLGDDRRPRPMLLISHSLGGLIAKQAASSERVSKAIRAVVFFGVPHTGMDVTSLMPMVGEAGPNTELVVSIGQTNSQFLARQAREFPDALEALGRPEVFCFYETEKSPTAVQFENGQWCMSGPPAVLVSAFSATHCILGADAGDCSCAINRGHSEIVKYAREDDVYDTVLLRLQSLAQRAVLTAATQKCRPADRLSAVRHLIPMRHNRNFTGRRAVLKELQDRFFGKHEQQRQDAVALVGLGGIGKTQVALEFSYWVREHKSNYSIFWISALSVDTFDQSCTDILRSLGVADEGDATRDVKLQLQDYLSNDPRASRWLLVLDNADDVALLRDAPVRLRSYLPHRDDGLTLITTRTEDVVPTSCTMIDLHGMPSSEAKELFQKSLDRSRVCDYDDEACEKLLDAIERLPLAISQTAAYLNRNRCTVEEYLGYLGGREEEAVELLSYEASSGEHWPVQKEHSAVMKTWLVSLDQMRQTTATATATASEGEERESVVQLLMFLSRIEPKAIPKSMLPSVGGSGVVLAQTMGTLLSYAFLTKREGDMYDMHSLVHLAIRSWISRQGLAGKAAASALTHLRGKMPVSDRIRRAVWTAYMPHALRALASSGKAEEQTE